MEIPDDRPVHYRWQHRKCGKASCSCHIPPHPGHGPYLYAVWFDGTRSQSRYCGKAHPDLAELTEGIRQCS